MSLAATMFALLSLATASSLASDIGSGSGVGSGDSRPTPLPTSSSSPPTQPLPTSSSSPPTQPLPTSSSSPPAQPLSTSSSPPTQPLPTSSSPSTQSLPTSSSSPSTQSPPTSSSPSTQSLPTSSSSPSTQSLPTSSSPPTQPLPTSSSTPPSQSTSPSPLVPCLSSQGNCQSVPAACEFYPFLSHNWKSGFDDRCFPVVATLTEFPYFTNRFSTAYICSNGLISFVRPFLRYRPELFSIDLTGRNIIAPFWADATVFEPGSRIYYRLYSHSDGYSDTATILEKSSKDVRARLDGQQDFSAIQVLVVTWFSVANYPDGFYDNYDASSSLRNTFQLVLATDGADTFSFFIYGDNGLQWSGRWFGKGVAGYVASSGLVLTAAQNVVGSGTDTINQIDDRIYNEVVGEQCGAFFHLSITPDAAQAATNRRECYRWYANDIRRYGLGGFWSWSLFRRPRPSPCPCSPWQAWRDFRYRRQFGFPGEDLSCFFTTFGRRSFTLAGGRLQRLRMETRCCYTFGSLTLTQPSSGYASPYHQVRDPYNYETYTTKPYQFCCGSGDDRLCELFYRRRPPISCIGYRPVNPCWAFGDPHMQTADGTKYTFNGRGEYILIQGAGYGFVMQSRMVPALDSNATVFSAFAMAAFPNGTDENYARAIPLYGIVHAELKGNKSISVRVRKNATSDWNDITDDYEALSSDDVKDVYGSFISRPTDGELVVRYSEGMSVTVTAKKGLITAIFAAPDEHKSNESRGLLGVWNDDRSDDFTARNGIVVSPNATDRVIHFDFGQTYQISENESLFYYPNNTGPKDFAFPRHEPPFIDELDVSAITDPALREACGNDRVCLYDGIQTGDVEVAAQTRATESDYVQQMEELGNFPPVLTGNDTIFAFTNQTVTYHLTVFDPNDTVTVTLNGTLPENYVFTKLDDSSYELSWTPKNASSVSIVFVANDSAGASSRLHPLIRLCDCRLDLNATCTMAQGSGGHNRFLIETCHCGTGWDGPTCDENEDGCSDFECFEGVECIDNLPPLSGARCGPCPNGSIRANSSEGCIDINECQTNSSGCAQLCINFPLLSYTCGCRNGYRLNPDGKSCDDVNECDTSRPCHQTCINTRGSFECSCLEGYRLDSDGATCIANRTCLGSSCSQGCAIIKNAETCFCRPGYQLQNDGKTCLDIDECAKHEDNDCEQLCLNTDGSYVCNCSSGFRLNADESTCDDIDECILFLSNCSKSQMCINTEGSFSCACPRGTFFVDNSCQASLPATKAPTAASTLLPTTDRSSTAVKATKIETTATATATTTTTTTTTTSRSIASGSVTPTATIDDKLVVVTLQSKIFATFNVSKFKTAAEEAILQYCFIPKTPCTEANTAALDVVIVNITEIYFNRTAQVYLYVTGGGKAFSASLIADSLNTEESMDILETFGFTIARISLVNPRSATPTTPSQLTESTTEKEEKKDGLSTGAIIGIAVGITLTVLITLSSVFVYWIIKLKKSMKVKSEKVIGRQEIQLIKVTERHHSLTPVG